MLWDECRIRASGVANGPKLAKPDGTLEAAARRGASRGTRQLCPLFSTLGF